MRASWLWIAAFAGAACSSQEPNAGIVVTARVDPATVAPAAPVTVDVVAVNTSLSATVYRAGSSSCPVTFRVESDDGEIVSGPSDPCTADIFETTLGPGEQVGRAYIWYATADGTEAGEPLAPGRYLVRATRRFGRPPDDPTLKVAAPAPLQIAGDDEPTPFQ